MEEKSSLNVNQTLCLIFSTGTYDILKRHTRIAFTKVMDKVQYQVIKIFEKYRNEMMCIQREDWDISKSFNRLYNKNVYT